ncbi:UNVERIFIED_CONTAM: hypothetical protein FKN15_002495 [Acipenser sinensis]
MQGGLSQRREPEQRLILQDLRKGARLFKTGSKASSDKRIPRVAAVTSIAINMMLVTAADIGTFTQRHNLEEVPIIPGTQSRHYTEPFMLGKIQNKTYSASKKSSIFHSFTAEMKESLKKASVSHCSSKSTTDQPYTTKKLMED